MEAAAGEKTVFETFPRPPGFYRLYQAGPDAGPEPPEPVTGEIYVLGETFNTDEPYVPPLDVPKLYAVQQDGSVAIKQELLKLNKGLLFLFLELLSVLVQQPSQYAVMLTQILVTLHNMTHLINMARPLQAQETLKYALQSQIKEKKAALSGLREQAAKIKQELLVVTQQLAAVGGDAAESVPRPAPAQHQQLGPAAATAAAMEEG